MRIVNIREAMGQSTSRLGSVLWAIGLTYGTVIVGSFIVFIGMRGLAFASTSLASRPLTQVLASSFLLQGITFVGISLTFLIIRDTGLNFVPFTRPSKTDIAVIVGGILAVFGILLGASAVIDQLGLESAQNVIIELGRQDPAVFLMLIPLSFLLIGPGEEFLFRGVVQGLLRETLHPVRAIVLASGLFASIHLFSLTGSGKPVYIALAFGLALVLGAAYEFTDNLTVPAVIHGAYNAIQFAGAYVSVTGGL